MARREVIGIGDDQTNSEVADFTAGIGQIPDKTGHARQVDSSAGIDDEIEESHLRPRRLDEFVGQTELKEHLSILLQAAKGRGEPTDHILFAGPPGLGKTSLAGIVAHEMGAGFRVTSGPNLARSGDLAAIVCDLEDGDVLFIDEIHRMPKQVEEVLYPAMEDFKIDILLGKGPAAKSVRLDLPRFTLVGATTRTGMVTGPLRDRFGFVARLDFYESGELEEIVVRAARIFSVHLDQQAASEIARRSRGTPRIANRLLRRVRDFAQVRGSGEVDLASALEGLKLFGIDDLGLDKVDRSILTAMCVGFGGRAVGLSTLAIAVGEEPETVEDAYEPYLLRQGLLIRTPRGRVPGPSAWSHLGISAGPGAVTPEVALADQDSSQVALFSWQNS